MKRHRKLYRWLISPKIAMAVLLLITIAVTLGAVFDAEKLQIGDQGYSSQIIFASPWFLGFNLLLLIITLACCINQFRIAKRKWQNYRLLLDEARDGSLEYQAAISNLRGIGYQVYAVQDEQLMVSKHVFSMWAAPIFHLGLAVIMFGAFLDCFADFTGYVYLRAGQSVEDQIDNYRHVEQGPLFHKSDNNFVLALDKIMLEPKVKGISSLGEITVYQQGKSVKQGVISHDRQVNLGLIAFSRDSYGYYAFYQINNGSHVLVDHALGLETTVLSDRTEYTAMPFAHNGTPYEVEMEFFPDLLEDSKPSTNRGYALGNQAIHLKLYHQGKVIYDGIVKKGETVELTTGDTFSFRGVEPYLKVRVQWQLGYYIVCIGFVVFVIGLLLYYLIRPQVLLITNTSQGWLVKKQQAYSKEISAYEFERIEDKLRG